MPRVNALFKLATTASILLGITLAGGALERQWLATEIPFGRWLVAAVAVGVAVLSLVQTCMVGGLCGETVLWICLACLIVATLVCTLSVYRAGRVLIQNHEYKHI